MRLPAKFLTPVPIRDQHSIRSVRRIIPACEEASERRHNSKQREYPVGYVKPVHVFWFTRAGHAKRIPRVNTDILERRALLAVDEVDGG